MSIEPRAKGGQEGGRTVWWLGEPLCTGRDGVWREPRAKRERERERERAEERRSLVTLKGLEAPTKATAPRPKGSGQQPARADRSLSVAVLILRVGC